MYYLAGRVGAVAGARWKLRRGPQLAAAAGGRRAARYGQSVSCTAAAPASRRARRPAMLSQWARSWQTAKLPTPRVILAGRRRRPDPPPVVLARQSDDAEYTSDRRGNLVARRPWKLANLFDRGTGVVKHLLPDMYPASGTWSTCG